MTLLYFLTSCINSMNKIRKAANHHLSVVNVVARLPFYRRLPIFMYCFILLLLSRLSWYNKNVRLQEMGDVVKGVIKEVE